MDERFDFGGLSLPCRVCRERLEAVAARVAPLYQCSPHAVLGMLLLKASAVIVKADCSLRLCQRGLDCSMRRLPARES
jgi:hypothetical protein